MQKSLDIFKAEPQSVFDVICDRKNTGFYMPAYQRPFSWEEKHIRDLFSDCENVFRNLLDSPDAIIFLGSILTVDDSAAETIYPLAKRHTPTHIKLIIDGQQRLTTLILIILSLNERLNIILPKLKNKIDKEQNENKIEVLENLREVVSQLIQDTSNFAIETQADHELYKFFPKVIRSQVDCWGKDDKKAIYNSPLSEVLIKYQHHIIQSKNSTVFKPMQLNEFNENSKRVVDNIKEIRKQLDYVQAGFKSNLQSAEQDESLSINDLVNKDTLDECLDFPIDEDLAEISQGDKIIQDTIFVSVFARFLLHRVCLTYVEVNNESYAFDMFEALNTTGEPLTAIETFVPKVIEHIGNKTKYNEENIHETRANLKSITDRFDILTKTKDKNDKTKALILAFVRAYEGKVKITSLRDQRDAMLKSYEACLYADKDNYLEYLKKTSDFLFDSWQAKVPNLEGTVVDTELDLANLCIRYLTDIKHDITQSLLVQFILLDEKYGLKGEENNQFLDILKAITSLSVLWRAMSGGADGIDGVYKKLHEKGFDLSGVLNKPYQLSGDSLNNTNFDSNKVKAFFKHELESKIISKESPKASIKDKWLDICSKQQMLSKPKTAKFLTLAGFHGIEFDNSEFKRKESNNNNYFTTTMWDLFQKPERITKVYDNHITSSDSWNPSLSAPEVFNKLGNILVDARCDITSNKKRSWYETKQKMLSSLNNDSIKDLNDIISSSSTFSEETKRNFAVLMLESKYSEITYANEWSEEVINQRTELLLSNAWENLIEWLE